jgi:hypothetical protein
MGQLRETERALIRHIHFINKNQLMSQFLFGLAQIPAIVALARYPTKHRPLWLREPIARQKRKDKLLGYAMQRSNPDVVKDGAGPIPPLTRRAELLSFNRSDRAVGTLAWRSEPVQAAVVFLLVFAGMIAWILGPHHRKAHKRLHEPSAVLVQLRRIPQRPEGPVPTEDAKVVRVASTNTTTQP